jgi:hypothetical protein
MDLAREVFYPGPIEEVVPNASPNPRQAEAPISTPTPTPAPAPAPRPDVLYPQQMIQVHRASINTFAGPSYLPQPLSLTLPVALEQNPEPKYANLPPDMLTGVRGRCSMETTASTNPDEYLISDGFRPLGDPPEYSSRPPSIHS